jgi:hypothetical protein
METEIETALTACMIVLLAYVMRLRGRVEKLERHIKKPGA